MNDWWTRLKSFLIQTRRVLQVTRKPTQFEFRTTTCHAPSSYEYQPSPFSPAAEPNRLK